MYKILLVAAVLATSPAALAVEFEGSAQPADVLVHVTKFARDLEAVRLYMGKPAATREPFRVEFATPRHSYYQAQTLFWKTNRLGQKVAGSTRQSAPVAPNEEILPEDVLRAVRLAQEQLDLIRDSIGITTSASPPRRNSRAEPKDVFEAMMQAIRQVNLMNDEPFRPSNVHRQLTVVSVYLAGVIAKIDEEMFPYIEFSPNKQPIDVYNKLVDCLVANQQIGEALGLPTLKVRTRKLRPDSSTISDNYDIATILVSDTAYWTDRLPFDEDVFPPTESLKHIFPAHVLAKVKLVEKQLAILKLHIDAGSIQLTAVP
jgi:hypothetical protein